MILILYILISPLISFFVGFFVNPNLIYYRYFASTSFSASLFLFVFILVGGVDDEFVKYSINMGPLEISWAFLMDVFVCIKLFIVTYISALLQVDSKDNIRYDPKYSSHLTLCTFFLLILLTGNNFSEVSVSWKV